jgi:hypothetical protein
VRGKERPGDLHPGRAEFDPPFGRCVPPNEQSSFADGKFESAFPRVKFSVPKIFVDNFFGWNRMTAARNGHVPLEK